MKLRHPGLIGLISLIAAWIVRVWLGTVRLRLYGVDGRRHPADYRTTPFIYSFWHEFLLYPTKIKTRIHILISQHTDGEIIARVCKHLGFRVVRGSTTRGGAAALMELMQNCHESHVAITPDGPRGPRRQLQMGAIYLASITGLPIVPVGAACPQAWRAGSWDRMFLPYPWSTAYCALGAPIHVPSSLDRTDLERYRVLVEQEMLRLTAEAEVWAATGRKPRPAPTSSAAAPRAEEALRRSA